MKFLIILVLLALTFMSLNNLFKSPNTNDVTRISALNSISNNSSLRYLYEDISFTTISASNSKSTCNQSSKVFWDEFAEFYTECFTIKYIPTNYSTHAVRIKSKTQTDFGGSKLLVYNHGHGGLPSKEERFSIEFLLKCLNSGMDVLIVSMPFTGVDERSQPVAFNTWDGKTVYNPSMLTGVPSANHGIFEMVNTGKSNYMRFFVDSAVINRLRLKKEYKTISFVGLSGGATTGLYTCNLLNHIVNNCVLVAGVMPLKFRFDKKTFGDSEQISSSFYKKTAF